MTAQELKNSILQLAIQGKLVPQDPNDEPASVLLEKIRKEKAELVKQGKIKKDKQESYIFKGDDGKYYEKIGSEIKDITDEIPFDIPNNWEWVKCGNLFSTQSGLSFKKDVLSEQKDGSVRILRGGNILNDKYHFLVNDIFISRKYITKDIYLKKNWIITPAVTSIEQIGKMALIDRDIDDCVVGGFVLNIIPHLSNDILAKYLLFAMMSNYFIQSLKGITNKSGQAFYNLSREKMLNLYIPLPPLSEQKRIVKKIEELEPFIERYGQAETELTELNTNFPEQIKKSILQYAIQGKLIPQDPNDEPASVLLEKIRKEKAELVKQGKIKKDKQESYIFKGDDGKYYEKIGSEIKDITDEIPFDIPNNWEWVRLKNTCLNIFSGKSPKYSKSETPHKIIGQQVNQDYGLDYRYIKYGTDDFVANMPEMYYLQNYDVLLNTLGGGTVGRSGIFISDNNEKILTDGHLFVFRLLDISTSNYLLYYLKLKRTEIERNANGSTNQTFLNLGKTIEWFIPLPPLPEQERIVTKIEELNEIIDKL